MSKTIVSWPIVFHRIRERYNCTVALRHLLPKKSSTISTSFVFSIMADPLSIATGILTFMGACNALASTIKKLHRLRKAPQQLEELENEISSLQSYIEGIQQLVGMHSNGGDEVIGRMSLGMHIENARKKIQEIENFLEGTLVDVSSPVKIRTRGWLKWQSELNRLRQELRDVRLELGTCVGLFSA